MRRPIRRTVLWNEQPHSGHGCGGREEKTCPVGGPTYAPRPSFRGSFFPPGKMTGKDPNLVKSGGALGAGLTFAVTVASFALGGLWVDGKLGTRPLFVLVGVLLGILGGTIHLLRVVAPETLPFGKRAPRNGKPPTGT